MTANTIMLKRRYGKYSAHSAMNSLSIFLFNFIERTFDIFIFSTLIAIVAPNLACLIYYSYVIYTIIDMTTDWIKKLVRYVNKLYKKTRNYFNE